jgi:PAS domain-containing protein
VLVYRLDKLIYANRPFLEWTGYEHIHALEQAGGLDALFVEPSGNELDANNDAKSLTVATNRGEQLPVEARLFTSPWEGESALVLMLTDVVGGGGDRQKPSEAALRHAKAEAGELRAILDIATDGVVVLDREQRMLSVNRRAEALFGYDSSDLIGLPFASLFAPERSVLIECLNRLIKPARQIARPRPGGFGCREGDRSARRDRGQFSGGGDSCAPPSATSPVGKMPRLSCLTPSVRRNERHRPSPIF